MRSLFFLLVTSIWLPTAQAQAPQRPELELLQVSFERGSHELSGAALLGDKLVFVSDEPTDKYLLETAYTTLFTDTNASGGARFSLKRGLDLSQLPGFDQRRIDLEGLAYCPDRLYIANEGPREVLQLDLRARKLSQLALNFDREALSAGGINAGIEGIAVDCQEQLLFVAKERDPRMLLVFSLKDGQLLRQGNPPASDRDGQKVINPMTGNGLLSIGPDFADLVFDQGYLYALERNTYEIVKVDPKSFAALARVSYLQHEKSLYDTGEPFGTAEVLLMTAQEILIAFDNNGSPLSSVALQKYGISGPHGAVMRFKRPQGF